MRSISRCEPSPTTDSLSLTAFLLPIWCMPPRGSNCMNRRLFVRPSSTLNRWDFGARTRWYAMPGDTGLWFVPLIFGPLARRPPLRIMALQYGLVWGQSGGSPLRLRSRSSPSVSSTGRTRIWKISYAGYLRSPLLISKPWPPPEPVRNRSGWIVDERYGPPVPCRSHGLTD